MTIHFEVIGIVAVLILLLAGRLWLNSKAFPLVPRSSVWLSATFIVIATWVVCAMVKEPEVAKVTYHPVVRKHLPDGRVADTICVYDSSGVCHEVNINEALGTVVLENSRVKRIRYKNNALGILFPWMNPKYEIVD